MSEAADSLRIINATVLDVPGAQLLPDQTIVIERGRIISLEGGQASGSNLRVLDAHGLTVMPGLIDAHVHVMAAHLDLARLWNWPPSYTTAVALVELRALLQRGFTTVRDVAGADHGVAKAVAEGLVAGPRVLFAGRALSQTGGHGDMRDAGDDCTCRHSTEFTVLCDGVDEVRRAARNELRKGAHHVKLMLSGGVASPTDPIDSVQFSTDEVSAAVQEAKNAGRYVVGHAYTVETVDRALRCGVRSIEHGNLIDETSVALMVECRAFYVPTLITYVAMSEFWDQTGLPTSGKGKLSRVLDRGLAALDLAHKGGVQIAFGTDLLGELRSHQLREFLLRREVQQPIDIIRSATTTAAELINMSGEVGTVAVGAAADLLVLEGNPLADITVLTKPDTLLRAVVKGGVIVKNALSTFGA